MSVTTQYRVSVLNNRKRDNPFRVEASPICYSLLLGGWKWERQCLSHFWNKFSLSPSECYGRLRSGPKSIKCSFLVGIILNFRIMRISLLFVAFVNDFIRPRYGNIFFHEKSTSYSRCCWSIGRVFEFVTQKQSKECKLGRSVCFSETSDLRGSNPDEKSC